MNMQPIETVYNGYRFRSRLEARWAVFFDKCGIPYRYEVDGYKLADGSVYLPDFWIDHSFCGDKGWGFWVEIKPRQASDEELYKMVQLVAQTKHNGLIFQGEPYSDAYTVTKVSGVHFDIPKVWTGLTFRLWNEYDTSLIALQNDDGIKSEPHILYDMSVVYDAYTAARQARFEHGERP